MGGPGSGRQWQKGESGNPGGLSRERRAANRLIQQAAHRVARRESKLFKGMSNAESILEGAADRAQKRPMDRTAIACAEFLFVFAGGKPVTSVELSGPDYAGALGEMSEEEKRAFLETKRLPDRIREKLEAIHRERAGDEPAGQPN